MKRYFPDYRYWIKEQAKLNGLPVAEFVRRFDSVVQARSSRTVTPPEYVQNGIFCGELQALVGKGSHYFVESPELAAKLEEWGKSYDHRVIEAISEDNRWHTALVYTCGPRAVALLSFYSALLRALFVRDHTGGGGVVDSPVKAALGASAASRYKLAVGLFLYVSCFPESLQDGFPDFAKHPAHFKGKVCSAVKIVPQIVNRDGPIPHFRHGYPKLLRSPKFTNKRWSVIWVSECFVKGKVKTVEDNGQSPE